nr:ribonuclease H-like domain-containing protein [Tanacetum cinerariifolium]
MAESSNPTQIPSSPNVTLKEEPITLHRPESPNPFLPVDQVEFNFDEMLFTANNEVARVEIIDGTDYSVSRRNMDGLDQISNKGATIMYCLANGVNVDFAKIIREDLIHKLNKKSRERVIPYPRFISLSYNTWHLICNTNVPNVSKAPNPSFNAERVPQGTKLGAKPRHKSIQLLQHNTLCPIARQPKPTRSEREIYNYAKNVMVTASHVIGDAILKALENKLLSVSMLTHLGKRECVERIPSDGNLRELSGEEAWEAIDRCIAWDKVDNSCPQSSPQVLPSIKVYTPPVTYLEEVEETIGILMEVKSLDHTKLEDLGLNTCSHDLFPSSRDFPHVDEPEPQILPNFYP